MIPQHLENYNGNPPQGLVKTLTIWYIKHNLWGYEKKLGKPYQIRPSRK